MKKNILLLINGFGVEQAGSYQIYDSKLMPNLDRLTKERMFSTLASKDLDYKSGYRCFSIGIDKPLTYSLIGGILENEETRSIPAIKGICELGSKRKSKIHIFCYWENSTSIEHLMIMLKEMCKTQGVLIFVHLILCQKSMSDYKNMDNIITRINYEYREAKIGTIVGSNQLNSNLTLKEYVKALVTEAGEKWKDIGKKIEVLTSTRTTPENTRAFSMNPNFKITSTDQLLFLNYSSTDLTKLLSEIETQKYVNIDKNMIKYYSLFPTKTNPAVPFIYNYVVSSTYAVQSLKTIGAKCLIMDLKEKCPYINYYFNGLRSNADPDLSFIATNDNINYDKTKILELIKTRPQELIIINYEIDDCKNVEEIEDRLRKIDEIIGEIEKLTVQNNYGFFISSLYGIETELYNSKHELCKINFSTKVPLIVCDNQINKTNCSISEGTTYDLSNTIFSNINNKFNGSSLLRKKSALLSIFYKKGKKQ